MRKTIYGFSHHAMVRVLGLALIAAWQPVFAQEALRPVKLVELSPQPVVEQRSFPGRVRASQTIDLAFQVSGQLQQFPVVEGDRLEEGALIARLKQSGFERDLRQAEATLTRDRQTLARLQPLAGTSVPRSDVEAAETQVTLSEIAVETAESALADASLAAPFNALVARRMVANFTTIAAAEPVVRLHDMSEMLIDIDVPEVLARRSGEGDVSFTATFPGSSDAYALFIREFEAESGDVGQTFRLTLGFADEPAANILPGASAMVLVRRESAAERAVTLPQSAMVYSADGDPHIFVYEPDPQQDGTVGTVVLTPVTIRLRDDARIEVIEGPPSGTEIVAAGAAQISDGQVVRRFVALGE